MKKLTELLMRNNITSFDKSHFINHETDVFFLPKNTNVKNMKWYKKVFK